MSRCTCFAIIGFVKDKFGGVLWVLQNIEASVLWLLNGVFVIEFGGVDEIFYMLYFDRHMNTGNDHKNTSLIVNEYANYYLLTQLNHLLSKNLFSTIGIISQLHNIWRPMENFLSIHNSL